MNAPNQLKFNTGLGTLFRGFSAIVSDFRVLLYTLVPIFISLFIVYFMFRYGWDLTGQWVNDYVLANLSDGVAKLSWLSKTLDWLFNILLKFLMILILTYFSFILIQLISIPFYALICERILFKKGVFPDRPFRLMPWVRLNIRLFYISLIRMAVFLMIWIVVFALSFIPGLQFLGIFYSALVIAFDGMDYTLEIYEMSLGERLKFYTNRLTYFSGAGLCLMPALFIPGLILLLLPMTVVGMCVQFAETEGKREYEKLIA